MSISQRFIWICRLTEAGEIKIAVEKFHIQKILKCLKNQFHLQKCKSTTCGCKKEIYS